MYLRGWIHAVTADFGKFWAGQTTSNFGSAFTGFALPLLVFRLTGAAVGLAVTSVATYLPWPLFGLLIGAWVDPVDRLRVMLLADLLRAAAIASIPALAAVGRLTIWWIYVVAFLIATLSVWFTLAQVAAVPSLVRREDLVAANGRVQASFAAAAIAGPALAGVLVTLIALPALLYFDALSFIVSAGSLALIGTSFNAAKPPVGDPKPPVGDPKSRPPARLRQDVADGLRYVFHHPVVRNIAILAAIANFLIPTVRAQLVIFANQRFHAGAIQRPSARDGQPGRASRRMAGGVV